MPTAIARSTPDRALGAIAALGAVALVLFLIVPRTSPGVLALLTLAIGLAGGLAAGFTPLRRMPLALGLVIALGGWGLASTLWAADRGEAVSKSALLAGLALAAGWVVLAVRTAEPEHLRRVARAGLIAFGAALAYLCIEELTGHALKRLLFLALPFTQPSTKHVVDPDDAFMVNAYVSNRNMAAMTMALWPMLLIVRTLVERARQLPVVASLLAMAVVTMVLSKHESSQFALVAAVIVLAITMARPRLGLYAVAAGWIVATLLVVPAASWGFESAKLHTATWLPNSARDRIVLWGFTAEQVHVRPIAGVGAASTKVLDTRRGPDYELIAGTRYQWRTGPHAHNIYLQIWYELGAIGAGLLCAAGLALIASLSRLPAPAVPFAAAAMTSAAVIAAFAWGLWQAWYLGVFAVGAVLMALAVQLVQTERRPAGTPR